MYHFRQVVSSASTIQVQGNVLDANAGNTGSMNLVNYFMRSVRREVIQTRKPLCIYHIPHVTIN